MVGWSTYFPLGTVPWAASSIALRSKLYGKPSAANLKGAAEATDERHENPNRDAEIILESILSTALLTM